jgi:hypothetical protein
MFEAAIDCRPSRNHGVHPRTLPGPASLERLVAHHRHSAYLARKKFQSSSTPWPGPVRFHNKTSQPRLQAVSMAYISKKRSIR